MSQVRPSRAKMLISILAACEVLRLACGYGWCSEYWNWDGRLSNSRDGQRWPAGDGVVITYINGIYHSVPEWEAINSKLQTLFGHEVRPFYNPSSGWWITDASKAGYYLLRRPANNTIAHALGQHLAQAVDAAGRGRVLHIAHSGGALVTYLAAQHHLSRQQRDKIDVMTFGGAHSISRKYFSGRVVNYYARNDPLVKLDRRAAELMKLTSNITIHEIEDKHNSTFVFLEGRAKQFALDHSLEGPTYGQVLRKEARAFRRAHFGPMSPLSWGYDTSLIRLVRKKVAQKSGMHHFFSADNLGIHTTRKIFSRWTGLSGYFSGKAHRVAEDAKVLVVPYELPERKLPFAYRLAWPWRKTSREDDTGGEMEPVAELDIDDADIPEHRKRKRSIGWHWYQGKRKDGSDRREVSNTDVSPVGEGSGQTLTEEQVTRGWLWKSWASRRYQEPRKYNPDRASQLPDNNASSEHEKISMPDKLVKMGRASKPPFKWAWESTVRNVEDVKTDTSRDRHSQVNESTVQRRSDIGLDKHATRRDDIRNGLEEDRNTRGAKVEKGQSGLWRWWSAGSERKMTTPRAAESVDQEKEKPMQVVLNSPVSRGDAGKVKNGINKGLVPLVDDESPGTKSVNETSEQETHSVFQRWWPLPRHHKPSVAAASNITVMCNASESQVVAPLRTENSSPQRIGNSAIDYTQPHGNGNREKQQRQEDPSSTSLPRSPTNWQLWPMFKGVVRGRDTDGDGGRNITTTSTTVTVHVSCMNAEASTEDKPSVSDGDFTEGLNVYPTTTVVPRSNETNVKASEADKPSVSDGNNTEGRVITTATTTTPLVFNNRTNAEASGEDKPSMFATPEAVNDSLAHSIVKEELRYSGEGLGELVMETLVETQEAKAHDVPSEEAEVILEGSLRPLSECSRNGTGDNGNLAGKDSARGEGAGL